MKKSSARPSLKSKRNSEDSEIMTCNKIELIVFDIDGVITDGSMIVNADGIEMKRINLKDVDAIFELHRRGFKLAAITGEDTPIVDYFEKRFPWEYFYRGSKTKKDAMLQIEQGTGVPAEKICYVGDGKYDVEPLRYAGLGICPANAIDAAKMTAQMILQNDGGEGCLWELLSILEEYNDKNSPQNYVYRRIEAHTNIFKIIATDRELMDSAVRMGDTIVDFYKSNGAGTLDVRPIAAEYAKRLCRERLELAADALAASFMGHIIAEYVEWRLCGRDED